MQSFNTLKSWPVPNVAASVIADDAVHTFGDVDQPFELMSVTKLLASYGFLIALEEGVFELDTPLGPEGSTVRHLLSHASGVAANMPVAEKGVAERRIYSSAGMDILADAVAQEVEMPYREYLQEALFAPLGMTNSKLWGSAGFGARSSVADLTAFAQEIIAPTLISAETFAEACTVQFPELIGTVPGYGMQKPCPWGLGFEIKGSKSPHWTGNSMPANTVGHFGQSGTFLWMAPGTGKAGVVLTDRDFGPWAKEAWTPFNDEVWAELNA